MKTTNDLILIGLGEYKKEIQEKIKTCLDEYNVNFLTVTDINDLISDLGKYRGELAEIAAKIKELEPVFNADDIPF